MRTLVTVAAIALCFGTACTVGVLDPYEFEGYDIDAGITGDSAQQVDSGGVGDSAQQVDSGGNFDDIDGGIEDADVVDVVDDASPPRGDESVDVVGDPEEPFVEILSPIEGSEVTNPVLFRFVTGGGVMNVAFICDDWPLQDAPIPAERGEHAYSFIGVNRPRTVIMLGFGTSSAPIARDSVTFVPSQPAFD